jgi:hypothetical protein
MKPISEQELQSAVPVGLSREGRLLHWASLVRKWDGDLMLLHNLEYMSSYELQRVRFHSSQYGPNAFKLAVNDPILQAEGLHQEASLLELMKFMDIDSAELHEFSCDCGGAIDNEGMANRIVDIAARTR